MMTHIEGPIVQGFYDAALLSWSLRMDPLLPLISSPSSAFSSPTSREWANAESPNLPRPAPSVVEHPVTGGQRKERTGESLGASNHEWDEGMASEAKTLNAGLASREGITNRLSE